MRCFFFHLKLVFSSLVIWQKRGLELLGNFFSYNSSKIVVVVHNLI